jgi:exodeoxyribonuclease-5
MMEFELTEGQKIAMAMIEDLMKAPPPMPAIITGYAGTGKTTMLRAIGSAYGPPTVLAPTGKAALRVQEATGMDAMTIHRWLYKPKEDKETGEIKFDRKDFNEISVPNNKLVVVDESSMVGRDLYEDLWDTCQKLKLKLLLVGDTFQLAPVEMNKDPNDFPFAALTDVRTEFKAHLTEITRQALDNPILRASMVLRETNDLAKALRDLNRVFMRKFDDTALDIYKANGAVLVHKNDTRHKLNRVIRQKLNLGSDVLEGEPLLVLRNTYEIERYNGEVVTFQGWKQYDATQIGVRDRFKNISAMMSFGVGLVDAINGEKAPVLLSPEQVHGENGAMNQGVIFKAGKRYYGDTYHDEERDGPLYEDGMYMGPPHLHCNFGYALTCHKSQGSEWPQVLVLIENSTRPTTYEGRRWLYTAITRAKEKCFFSTEI